MFITGWKQEKQKLESSNRESLEVKKFASKIRDLFSEG